MIVIASASPIGSESVDSTINENIPASSSIQMVSIVNLSMTQLSPMQKWERTNDN